MADNLEKAENKMRIKYTTLHQLSHVLENKSE